MVTGIKSLMLGSILWCCASGFVGAADSLIGVYRSIPDGTVLPGGLKNTGAPAHAAIRSAVPTPGADAAAHTQAPQDPWELCQVIGPFRMMAQPLVKIELVPSSGRLVMLFEDISHGFLRTFHFDRDHPRAATVRYPYQGDSIARREGNTLVVDTVGFDGNTWLTDKALASDALHLTERLRPVLGGRYIEYRVTAADPKVLMTPYSYVRYFEKVDSEIEEDECEIISNWSP